MNRAYPRRMVLAAAGSALLLPVRRTAAAEPKRVALELIPRDLALRQAAPSTPVWRFAPADALRFAQGDQAEITISNRLPVGAAIHWRGLDGAASQEPLLARPPIPPGGSATHALSLSQAGTMACEAWLAQTPASLPILPVIVAEKTAVETDRDVVILIEDLLASEDGLQPIHTVNGQITCDIEAALNERLRLRFINGSQNSVFAVQLAGLNVQVAAIDGQPSEPFLAREGRLVLAPGTRIDAIVDITGPGSMTLNDGSRSVSLGEIKIMGAAKRLQTLTATVPLPPNGLPDQLPLQTALRADMPLDGRAPWVGFAEMGSATPPAFAVKRGRSVVLALRNPGDAPVTFRLHGHHMRLLDRLDDGWKPFWLDTVAVPPKQTLRVAFAATNAGLYLLETSGAERNGPRLLRSYRVDT